MSDLEMAVWSATYASALAALLGSSKRAIYTHQRPTTSDDAQAQAISDGARWYADEAVRQYREACGGGP